VLKKIAVGVCFVMLAACGGVQVKPAMTFPQPLVEKVPGAIGVYYPEELRQRTHSEERRGIKFSVALGGASVTNIDRLLAVLFERVVPLAGRSQVSAATPPVALAVVPWLDEYSFVTPQEMASREYSVTIRFRFELLDPKGATVDQLTLTGFGTAPMAKMSAAAPLTAATQVALRDLAAKFILDFPQQDSVVRLLRGETLTPLATEQDEVAATLGVFEAPPAAPGTTATPATSEVAAAMEPPSASTTPAASPEPPPPGAPQPPAAPEPAPAP
jgi:hypothetical protein